MRTVAEGCRHIDTTAKTNASGHAAGAGPSIDQKPRRLSPAAQHGR